MKRDLNLLAGRSFDVLVIGGGIIGAGVARDAAMRGLSVALVDKGDFASGTSSRSSKLIHGGFRYLEQRAFGLVRESCRERDILRRIAPHLVRPLPFLLPVYEGSKHSLTKMRLGMTLYDLLALYRNPAPHRALSAAEALREEPSLAATGLRGAIRFYDCQEDDARFCIENILHAADLGAACANYCEVIGFDERDGRVHAVRAIDRLSDTGTFTISARAVVNAAGPWVDRVARLGSSNGAEVTLSPTKGVHLLLPRLTSTHGLFAQTRDARRMIFVIPWHGCTLLGTTDTDFLANPDDAATDPADVNYLLAELNALMPQRALSRDDIITTFAGVRALLNSRVSDPSARPREHRIVRHGQNLLSVAGGKYTTYRAIAEQVVDQLFPLLGTNCAPPCRTADSPLPDHRPPLTGERIADSPTIHASDILHACRDEMAMTVTDIMRRRTSLALSRHHGPDTAAVVARIMATVMGWDDIRMNRSLREYVVDQDENRRRWQIAPPPPPAHGAMIPAEITSKCGPST